MSWSLSSINDAINSYNKKISEREAFISSATTLISDATESSKKLGEASDNLSLGLTIGGQVADGGLFKSMSSTISKNVSTLQGAVNLASAEIKIFRIKLNNLLAEKQRLIYEARNADRQKEDKTVIVRKTVKEALE